MASPWPPNASVATAGGTCPWLPVHRVLEKDTCHPELTNSPPQRCPPPDPRARYQPILHSKGDLEDVNATGPAVQRPSWVIKAGAGCNQRAFTGVRRGSKSEICRGNKNRDQAIWPCTKDCGGPEGKKARISLQPPVSSLTSPHRTAFDHDLQVCERTNALFSDLSGDLSRPRK